MQIKKSELPKKIPLRNLSPNSLVPKKTQEVNNSPKIQRKSQFHYEQKVFKIPEKVSHSKHGIPNNKRISVRSPKKSIPPMQKDPNFQKIQMKSNNLNLNSIKFSKSQSPQKQRGIYSEYVHPNNAEELEKQRFKGISYHNAFNRPEDKLAQSPFNPPSVNPSPVYKPRVTYLKSPINNNKQQQNTLNQRVIAEETRDSMYLNSTRKNSQNNYNSPDKQQQQKSSKPDSSNKVFRYPQIQINKEQEQQVQQKKYMFSNNAQVSKVMYQPMPRVSSISRKSTYRSLSPNNNQKNSDVASRHFSIRKFNVHLVDTNHTLDNQQQKSSLSYIKSIHNLQQPSNNYLTASTINNINSQKSLCVKSLNDLALPGQHRPTKIQIENYMQSMSTIEPKVIEPYERFPEHIPRYVAIERKKKLYSQYNIMDIFKKEKINLQEIMQQGDSILPLDLFDDTNFDDYSNEQWIQLIQPIGSNTNSEDSQKILVVKAIHYDKEKKEYSYQKGLILDYDAQEELFQGEWVDVELSEQQFSLPRFYICFDAEDPRKYVKRIKQAMQQRIYCNCLIKYNYIIDCMPTEDQAFMDEACSKRIVQSVRQGKKKKFSRLETSYYMAEVSLFYKRVMNKLCLDQFLKKENQDSSQLYPVELISQLRKIKRQHKKKEKEIRKKQKKDLMKKKNALFLKLKQEQQILKQYKKENPKNIQVTIEKDNENINCIQNLYQKFIFSTIYIEPAASQALLMVRETCLQAQELRLFHLDFQKEETLEQFIFLQECKLVSIMTYLTEQWVQSLADHILSSFQNVGKGWFNIEEQNRQSFEFSKLKKFLTMIRFMMEDTVNFIVQNSYKELNDYLVPRIPTQVLINSLNNVENLGQQSPLFATEISFMEKAPQKIVYTENPDFAEKILTETLTKALKEITKIPDLTPLVLKSFFHKDQGKQFITVPVLVENAQLGSKYNWLREDVKMLKFYIKQAVQPLKTYIKLSDKYKDLLNSDTTALRIELEKRDQEHDLEVILSQYKDNQQIRYEVEQQMPKSIQVGCFTVDQSLLKESLNSKFDQIDFELKSSLSQKMRVLSAQILQKQFVINQNLGIKPRVIEDVLQIQTFIEMVPKTLKEFEYPLRFYYGCVKTLEFIRYKPSYSEFEDYCQIYGFKNHLNKKIHQIQFNLANQTQTFKQDCMDETVEFTNKILQLKETIQYFKQFTKLNDYEDNLKVGNYINSKFTQYLEQGMVLNKRQKLFNIEVTNYSSIGSMSDEFEFFFEFWNSVSEWKLHKETVLNQPLKNVKAKQTKKILEQNYVAIRKCKKVFQRMGQLQLDSIVEEMIKDLNDFKEYLPIILALCKEGIRERHWIQFFELMKFEEFSPQTLKKICFKQFAEKNIIWYKDQILDISEKAFKEFSIEESIGKINNRWQNTKFTLLKHENTVIISDFDDKLDLMDEDIIKTQRLNFSIYKKPFEEQILNWNRNLKAMTEIIEEWQKFQQKWLYLQPLFDSPDISEQLPLETKKFNTINSFWRHLMLTVRSTNNVSVLCLQPGIQNRLSDGNKSLEAIQNELNNYLEKKCEAFGRFYFLSNNDLITILSLQKQPQLIQSHLKTVFENISKITFLEDNYITHMYSGEGEEIKLYQQVTIDDKLVETWLKELESSMQITVKKSLIACFKDSQELYFEDLMKFIKKHPGMHIITVCKIIQTMRIEQAFQSQNYVQSLNEYKHQLEKKILDVLVQNIRTETNQMLKTTINSLIVSTVYNIELADQFTKHNEYYTGSKGQNFDWLIQLRFYLQQNEEKELECVAKCLQCEQAYGYEYLGNTYRLVITPLTQKCWVTMMQAIKYYYGGMAAGPAGSGKTETIKDLSKAIAKQCVVFNCSDSMDYIILAKFFKGLASSGAWCCFDEFNRMNIEVLSVIAQQLLILFRAKKLQSLDKLQFEGSEIQANYSFSVFVTMNPGYQGKVELPDNLKSIFRVCAMIVPNNDIITEIILYSQGFKFAKNLSQIIVSIIKLVQEQLSSQPHYDFGLRCIKFIIKMADKFKAQQLLVLKEQEQSQEINEELENLLIFKSILCVNQPKLVGQDKQIFKSIVDDAFKTFNFELNDEDDQLKKQILNTLEKQKYQKLDYQIEKMQQLAQALKTIHGIMIIGHTGTGKSTTIEVMQKSFSEKDNKINTYFINPKSVQIGQLYGETTDQWKDGVLTNVVRKCQQDHSSHFHWIVMDGPIDTFWIESINSVLDDTKKLCLPNSEVITFTSNMGMIFEIENLENSSPAIVSRCLMIYMNQMQQSWNFLIESYIQKLPPAFKHQNIDQKLQQMTKYYLPQCVSFFNDQLQNISLIYQLNEYNIVQNFLSNLKAHLKEFEFQQDIQDLEVEVDLVEEDDQNKNNEDQQSQSQSPTKRNKQKKPEDKIPPEAKEKAQNLKLNIEPIFIQCLLWTFQPQFPVQVKQKFNALVKQLIENDLNFAKKKIMPLLQQKQLQDQQDNEQTQQQQQNEELLDYYFFDTQKLKFVSLKSKCLEISSNSQDTSQNVNKNLYQEMLVHNEQSLLIQFQMKKCIDNLQNTLLIGPSHTGKSKILQNLIEQDLDPVHYSYQELVFSGQTTLNQLREFLFSKLEKRRKRIVGPQLGKTHVFYIDDMSQPRQNEFFQQPTLELLREFLSYKGTYNLKDLDFIAFEDCCVIGCTDQIQKQSQRLISQFITFGQDFLDFQQLHSIFSQVQSQDLKDFSRDILEVIQDSMEANLSILKQVREVLFPTPSKLFYNFTINEVQRIMNTIKTTDKTYIDNISTFFNLWFHENYRAYSDRLLLDNEKQFIKRICLEHLSSLAFKFKLQVEDIVKKNQDMESLIWTEYLEAEDEFSRLYKPVTSLENLVQKMNALQLQYNLDSSIAISKKKTLNLIMFQDAVISIAKIARALQIEQGHCLVIGTGGKGRSSLSRLGCYAANLKLFEAGFNQSYSVKLWQEELKKVLLLVSAQKTQIGFIISCKKINENQILNDINQILQSYELSNILNDKQFQDIYASCQVECVKKGMQPTQQNIQMIHKSRVRQNFHIIMPMTPTRSDFSLRLREYRFFTKNCQVIYLNKWSDESLVSVSKTWIKENSQQEYLKIGTQQEEYIQASLEIHRLVENIAQLQYKEQNKKIHIEPIQFIETFSMFKNIAQKKQEYITQQIQRMQKGVITLRQGQEQVRILESELIVLKPQLEESKKQLAQLVDQIKQDQQSNEEKQLQVQKEQEEAMEQKKLATVFKKQAEESVKESEQSMKETLQNIRKLKKEHLTEIKSLTSPPQPVKTTIAGVVILFEEKIKKKGGSLIMSAVEGDENQNKFQKKDQGKKQNLQQQKEVNYFETAKRYLMNDQRDLLDSLMHYDTSQISEQQMVRLKTLVLEKPEFCLEAIKKVSHATKYLYLWIKCMVDYYNTQKQTEPIRIKLAEMKVLLKTSTKNLENLKTELNIVQQNLDNLEQQLFKSKEEQKVLDQKISDVKLRHERAMQLTYGLEDEGVRWEKQYAQLQQMYEFIPGNSFMVAQSLISFGPLGIKYRKQLTEEMIRLLEEKQIKTNSERYLINYLADDAKIYSLYSLGVAKDENSTQNALILDEIKKWPILIDPQSQAQNYLKNYSKGFIQLIWESDPNLQRTLELGIQSGQMVVVKTNSEEFNPMLSQFFDQSIEQCKKEKQMKFMDKALTYNENFRIIMCTNMQNPNYAPEIYVKLAVLNFSVSSQALEEQMLAQIILLENPYLEKKKSELMEEKAKAKVKLREIENVILKSLSEQTDVKNLLNDQELVSQLSISKQVVKEIEQVLEQSEITTKEIDHSREDYRPLAIRANLLYLSIQDLSPLNIMYKYSLEWFQDLFAKGLKNLPIFKSFQERINYIIDSEMKMIYENVCMSLYQEDKLLFSFFIAIRLLREKGKFNQQEYDFLIQDTSHSPTNTASQPDLSKLEQQQLLQDKYKKPLEDIPEEWWKKSYMQLVQLQSLIPDFENIMDLCLIQYAEEFVQFFQNPNPYQYSPFFQKIQKTNNFQKLLLIKIFRPDKLHESLLEFLQEQLGEFYLTLPNANIETLFPNSTYKIPLIFILKQGIDPRESFLKFVDNSNMNRRHLIVSLGQGQGKKAEDKIRYAQKRGYWILLENCHLSISWLPTLDSLTTQFDPQLQDTYRLWLTTMPTSQFPMEILQNGIKMALYPPQGIKANLSNLYNNISDIDLNDCSNVEVYKKMVFSMSFLHSILQDRNRFGPIGWNVQYDFSSSDLNLCKMQTKDILELLQGNQNIPFHILRHLIGQIHYDGIVTDKFDKILLLVLIDKFISPLTLEQGHQFSELEGYEQPKLGSHRHYVAHIQEYPNTTQPKLFGIHNNADILIGNRRTQEIQHCLYLSNPDSFSHDTSDLTKEQQLRSLVMNILDELPQTFSLEKIKQNYKIDYNKSINNVILQETSRYNQLLTIIIESLSDLKLALEGKSMLDTKTEQISQSLMNGKIPQYWNYYSFECVKPLSSWLQEIKLRVEYFHQWIEKQTPKIFWIGAFFAPRIFLVGIQMDYSRNMGHHIDSIKFETILTKTYYTQNDDNNNTEKQLPDLKQGVYIEGVYLQGGAWSTKFQELIDLPPLELTQLLPVIQLRPTANFMKQRHVYECPFYKTLNRYGQLNSIGQSVNFLMYLCLNGNEVQNADYWKQAGLAAFLNLNI